MKELHDIHVAVWMHVMRAAETVVVWTVHAQMEKTIKARIVCQNVQQTHQKCPTGSEL